MATQLNPYLSFRDNAREAMEFYQSVFGGTLDITTYEEYHASEDPAESDKVMHAQLSTDNGLVLMAADTPNSMELNPGDNVSISLSGASDDEDELRGCYEKLKAGGQEMMPLEKAPWGDTFGLLQDRFGIYWLVNIAGARSGELAA